MLTALATKVPDRDACTLEMHGPSFLHNLVQYTVSPGGGAFIMALQEVRSISASVSHLSSLRNKTLTFLKLDHQAFLFVPKGDITFYVFSLYGLGGW